MKLFKFKLSPLFMMAVIATAAYIPLSFGVGPETIMAAVAVVGLSALFVERGVSTKSSGLRYQIGEIGSTENIEKEYKEVQANLKKVGDDLRGYAEQVDKEIKASAKMSDETRAKVDEMLIKQGELQARLQETEQKLVNHGKPKEQEERKSAGHLVRDALTEAGVTSSMRGSHRINVPRAAVTSFDTNGASLVGADHRGMIAGMPFRTMTIRDLVAPGTTESNAVEYVKETGFTNAAAPVSENPAGSKPYSEITYELANANVRTIAHLFKASRQILDDLSGLQSQIDARSRYGLMLTEETQLLYGNGTGNNLNGMITQAEAYAAPSGLTVTAEQRIDRIRLAMLQVTLAEYPATGIVLHPTDWAMIEMLKDGQNRYIIGRPQDGTAPRLWGLPVVATQAITQDDFLVGAFALAAQIFDRMGIEVLVSTENDKDFEKNMVTVRAEERLAFAVYRPEALVTGSLTAS